MRRCRLEQALADHTLDDRPGDVSPLFTHRATRNAGHRRWRRLASVIFMPLQFRCHAQNVALLMLSFYPINDRRSIDGTFQRPVSGPWPALVPVYVRRARVRRDTTGPGLPVRHSRLRGEDCTRPSGCQSFGLRLLVPTARPRCYRRRAHLRDAGGRASH